MKFPLLIAATLLASTAQASPHRSQHPRVGELAEVRFSLNSARLAANANGDLGEVAAWSKENPDALIVLDGHTDKRGEGPKNVRLSLRRAQAVRDALVDVGVDPDMIVLAAYGSDGPRRATDAENRRVTIWGTHQDIQTVAQQTLRHGHGTAVLWSGLVPSRERTARR